MNSSRLLQIAPMVDWTNSPYRLFLRLMLPKAKLFTEMLVPQAIIRHPDRYLEYFPIENPLVLQLGGSHPEDLLQAAKIAEQMGYSEININLGCPSPRVQSGGFGACLMTEKKLVQQCLIHLKDNLRIPVTAKTRIGVDNQDSYAFFEDFIGGLIETGVDELIIHARKAVLKGLSPKENRTIPPIQYDYVYQIKETYPNTPMVINGEIKKLDAIVEHLEKVDGVMIGRLALDNPFALRAIYETIYQDNTSISREYLCETYLNNALENGMTRPISFYLKPLFNLYHGTMDAKKWKQLLMAAQNNKNFDLIYKAVA